MLSILIPTYNYNTLELVKEIHNQCENEGIIYEIIVLDDASTDEYISKANQQINNIPHCFFEKNETNLGRSKTRNILEKKAKYEWLLFLDCDTFPKEKKFIKNYVSNLGNESKEVFFGGICYKNTIPSNKEILRWKYGKYREEITVEQRKLNPYQTTLTSNLLIHKSIFEKIVFEEKIKEYGYEDLVFIENLKHNNFLIEHIDNCTYHLNYETSDIFLKKTEKALETLVKLENQQILTNTTKLQKIYQQLRYLKLESIYFWLFKNWKKRIVINLLSKNPSIFYFDLYKLGYFMILKSKK